MSSTYSLYAFVSACVNATLFFLLSSSPSDSSLSNFSFASFALSVALARSKYAFASNPTRTSAAPMPVAAIASFIPLRDVINDLTDVIAPENATFAWLIPSTKSPKPPIPCAIAIAD